jgi:hypothetical protein
MLEPNNKFEQKEPAWILPYEDIFRIEKNLISNQGEQSLTLTDKEMKHILAKLTGEFAQLKILMQLRQHAGKYGAVPVSTLTSYIQQLENILGIKWPTTPPEKKGK